MQHCSNLRQHTTVSRIHYYSNLRTFFKFVLFYKLYLKGRILAISTVIAPWFEKDSFLTIFRKIL